MHVPYKKRFFERKRRKLVAYFDFNPSIFVAAIVVVVDVGGDAS